MDADINNTTLLPNTLTFINYTILDVGNNEIASDDIVKSITVTSSNPQAVKIVDKNGELKSSVEFTADLKATDKIYISSVDSGTSAITMKIILKGLEGKEQILELTGSIKVINTTKTSFSIALKETNVEGSYFVDTYTVTAKDGSGNPIYIGQKLSYGVISGIKTYSNTFSDRYATMKNEGDYTSLFTTHNDFENVTSRDSVAILPNDNKNEAYYLGGWSIKSKIDDNTLYLTELFGLDEASGLSYAVGSEARLDICSDTLTTTQIIPVDEAIKDDGTADFKLRYEPYMVGKDIFLYANLSLKTPREGIATKATLKGKGLDGFQVSCYNPDEDNNESTHTPATCNFSHIIYLKDAPEFTAAQKVKVKSYKKVDGECSAYSVTFYNYSDGWSTDCEGVMNLQIEMSGNCEDKSVTIEISSDMMSEYQK
jgi:invasion protein IalB